MSDGRYPRLKDGDDLWKLLVTITCHKAASQARRVRARKRGGGHVRGESVFEVSSRHPSSEASQIGTLSRNRSGPPLPGQTGLHR
jgi:hypothetical protein